MYQWIKRLFADEPQRPAPVAARRAAAEAGSAQREVTERVQNIAAHAVLSMQHNQVDYLFSSWLFEMENNTEIFTNGNEDTILAELDATAHSEESGAHMVRRMPGVIPQLLQSLRSSDFSGAELARTISQDVVLVAEVLRLVNSVAYSPTQPVSSIDHAILVLGQDGLRQVITGVAFKPIINLKSGSFTKMVAPRLWTQSERCSTACRLLAQGEPVDPLHAFLAGLVQNIGLTVSLRIIDRLSDGRQPVGSPTFCNALTSHGRGLAVNIAREWHFPDTVVAAIEEQGADTRNPKISALGRVLLMGDHLSKIDMLTRQNLLSAQDRKKLLEDLSEKETDCLEQLAALEERSDEGRSSRRGAAGK